MNAKAVKFRLYSNRQLAEEVAYEEPSSALGREIVRRIDAGTMTIDEYLDARRDFIAQLRPSN